ncbi:MAG: hypothetical protein HQL08_09495 [Nitrospirae bacterium]|nr:hypothetical protein [Nitrospirota bacterium]
MTQTDAASKCMGCSNSIDCNLTRHVRMTCRGPYKLSGNYTNFWKEYYIRLQQMISVRKAGQVNL